MTSSRLGGSGHFPHGYLFMQSLMLSNYKYGTFWSSELTCKELLIILLFLLQWMTEDEFRTRYFFTTKGISLDRWPLLEVNSKRLEGKDAETSSSPRNNSSTSARPQDARAEHVSRDLAEVSGMALRGDLYPLRPERFDIKVFVFLIRSVDILVVVRISQRRIFSKLKGNVFT